MISKLLQILNVKEDEQAEALWLLSNGFSMGIFLATLSVGSTALFLDFFGGNLLALGITGAGLLGIGLTFLMSFLQTRFPFGWVATFLIALMVVSILFLYSLYFSMEDPSIAIFMFFVIATPFEVIAVLIFWGLFNRIYDLRQAKRIIGGIDTGTLIATLVALFSIPFLLPVLGNVPNLLLISAASAIFMMITVFVISKKFKIDTPEGKTTSYKEAKTLSIKDMLKSQYLLYMVLFVVMAVLVLEFVDYAFLIVAENQFPNEKDLASFLSLFEATIVIFAFLFQTFVTDNLIANYGLKVSLFITPVLLGIMVVLALAMGTFFGDSSQADTYIFFFIIVAGTKLFGESLRDALDEPAFKLYFMPLKSAVRLDAQTKVEGTFTVFAGFAAGLLLFVIETFELLSFVNTFLILIPLVFFWGVLVVKLYEKYRTTIKSNLQEASSSENSLIEASEKAHIKETITLNNLVDVNQEYQISVFKLIEKVDPFTFEQIAKTPTVLEGLSEEAHDFIQNQMRIYRMAPRLSDSDSESLHPLSIEKINKMLTETLGSGYGLKDDLGVSELNQLAGSIHAAERMLALQILCKHLKDENIFILPELLRDNDAEIRKAAILAAGFLKRNETYSLLVDFLDQSSISEYTASTLIKIGDDIIPYIDQVFQKRKSVNFAMLRMIDVVGRIGSPLSLAFLVGKLEYPDADVHRHILYFLTQYEFKAQGKDYSKVVTLLENEIGKTLWNLVAIKAIPKTKITGHLRSALEEELAGNYNKIYSYLSFLYDAKTVMLVKENMDSEDSESLAYAIEMLDIFLEPEIKDKLLPLLDDISLDEKINRLQSIYPTETIGLRTVYHHLIMRENKLTDRWTKACAIYAFSYTQNMDITHYLEGQIFHPDILIRSMAAWLIFKRDPDSCQKLLLRLPKEDYSELDTLMENSGIKEKPEKSIPSVFETVVFLKKVSSFSQLNSQLLVSIASISGLHTINESEEISSSLGTFIVIKGELELNFGEGNLKKIVRAEGYSNFFHPKLISATAKPNTTILALDDGKLINLMGLDSDLYAAFLDFMKSNQFQVELIGR
ncbi:MAG: MFS transporter [Cyclobacteriaceae bacterium]|nr:hypothetical protein [Cyclobacteriaceae bacterium]MCH8515536.1 MFS transporter [Cyclobacteriaceae bacterium]